MDASDVNFALLDRLRTALDRELAVSTGLAHEIIGATRALSVANAMEVEAERRLSTWPGRPQPGGQTPEERAELANREADAIGSQRRAVRHAERQAGRPPVSEQALFRAHAEAVHQAGGNVATAAEELARASISVDHQALQSAWEAARTARGKAESHLAMLEQQRALHGRKAAGLRSTLEEARRWLSANGLAMQEAEAV